MARVIQIVAIEEENDSSVVDEKWHATMSIDDPRTLCGVQLMGEDGYGPSKEKEGRVTCSVCRSVLTQVQAIKNWK